MQELKIFSNYSQIPISGVCLGFLFVFLAATTASNAQSLDLGESCLEQIRQGKISPNKGCAIVEIDKVDKIVGVYKDPKDEGIEAPVDMFYKK